MMDLALELGMPVSMLANSMSERELGRWQKYARTRLLPTRRLEYYLAQIACYIAITMGGAKDAKLSDFLFDFTPEKAVDQLEMAKKAFGYNPRKKRGA